MNNKLSDLWQIESTQQFAEVIASMKDLGEIKAFLSDVMTAGEITEVSSRLQAAKMLRRGDKYAEIIEKTALSSRTIARISDWMKNGCGGYAKAFEIMDNHHPHTQPVRADS